MQSVLRSIPGNNLYTLFYRRGLDPRALLQWGIIVAILSASITVGIRPSLNFLVLPIAAMGIVLYWRYPIVAFLLTVQLGMIIPYYGPGGLNLTMIGLALLIGLWVIGMIFEQRNIWFTSPETARPALIFLGIAVLAFGMGQLRWFQVNAAPITAQLGGLMVFLVSVGTFLFVSNKFKDLFWLQWFTWIFLIYGGLHMVSWILPWLGDYYSSLLFAYGTNGSMFWTWVATLAFSQFLFNRRLPIGVYAALFILTVATIYVAYVLNGGWKSGWMPPAISMAVILLLRSWRFGYVIALAAIYPAIQIFSNALSTDQYSYTTRMDAWILVGDLIKANPILGLGPANYYWYTSLLRIRGYPVNFNSHNQYVDLMAQTGILGVVAFLWLMFIIGKIGWRLRHRVSSGFERAYVYGALGGWAATLSAAAFGDWILPFVYNVGLDGVRASILPWIYFGGLVVLDVKYCQQPQSPPISRQPR